MTERHAILLNEIRYAERLCLRTARLYRRAGAVCAFMAAVGGSAALGALLPQLPAAISLAGAVLMAVFGAAALVVRPADKAAANEADAKRYARLRTEAHGMDEGALQSALDKVRETDVPEIEPLRDVAWNDLVREIGCPQDAVPLRWQQRMLAAIA